MRQEVDLVDEQFAKQIDLADIVEAQNRKRFNILLDQVEDGGNVESLEGKERELFEGRKEAAKSRIRKRSSFPNIPLKKPVKMAPQYETMNFNREIVSMIGKDLWPGRDNGLQRSNTMQSYFQFHTTFI